MKIFKNIRLIVVATMVTLVGCGSTSGNDPEINKPDTEKPEYTADYDDGTTIYINVKIAVDRKGCQTQSPAFFKEKLTTQWNEINARFNNCDKKHQLKRKYIFKPDLDDIIVYDGCSYWGENGADTKAIQRMDKNIFKLVVIYDFFYEGAEKGEYGGGCGNNNGIGTILVINASEGMKNKYNDHFNQYTYRAITHELGHFRGVIDLYADVVEGKNNPVNGEGFTPPHCLMNDYCYTPDEESSWSDYAIKIINMVGNTKQSGLIDELMYRDFADNMIIKMTINGTPANGKIALYPATYSYETWCNTVSKTPYCTYNIQNGSYIINNLRGLFFKNPENKWDRRQVFLVEATTVDGQKKYTWISDFMMHNSGMDGNKTYEVKFDF